VHNNKLITLITNTNLLSEKKTIDLAKILVAAGLKRIQVREKSMARKNLENFIFELRKITLGECELIINGSLELARKYNCDGVHLPEKSALINQINFKENSNLIFGRSVHNIINPKNKWQKKIDYIHLGSVFKSGSHPFLDPLDSEIINKTCALNNMQVMLVGGITSSNLEKLNKFNINGVAIMRELLLNKEPESTYINLEKKINEKNQQRN